MRIDVDCTYTVAKKYWKTLYICVWKILTNNENNSINKEAKEVEKTKEGADMNAIYSETWVSQHTINSVCSYWEK